MAYKPMPNGVGLHSHSEYEPPSLTIHAKEKVSLFWGGKKKKKRGRFYPLSNLISDF